MRAGPIGRRRNDGPTMRTETERLQDEITQALADRDKAREELEKVKQAVDWTMQHLKISDLFGTGSGEIPAAAQGWLPGMSSDNSDTERLDWVNKHGRVMLGQNGFVICLPAHISGEATLPDIYNVRHIIDLSR